MVLSTCEFVCGLSCMLCNWNSFGVIASVFLNFGQSQTIQVVLLNFQNVSCFILSLLTIVGGVDVISPPLWRHVASPLRRQGVLEVFNRKLTQGCCLLSKSNKNISDHKWAHRHIGGELKHIVGYKTQIYLSGVCQSCCSYKKKNWTTEEETTQEMQ